MGGETHGHGHNTHGHEHGHGSAHGHGHGPGHGHEHPKFHNAVIWHQINDAHHVDASNFKVRDWRDYKVANSTELLDVQKKLAQKGLKDPWLRNHVWHYDPQFGAVNPKKVFLTHLFTGWKMGLGLFLTVISVQYGYKKIFGSKDEHHGHGHDHKHH